MFPLFRIFVFALTQRRTKVGCSAFISPVLLFGQREVRGRRLMMIKRAVSSDLQITEHRELCLTLAYMMQGSGAFLLRRGVCV